MDGVSSQIHTTAVFLPDKACPIPIVEEVEWAQESCSDMLENR